MQIENEVQVDVSESKQLAALIMGTAQIRTQAVTWPVAYRVPVHLLVVVDAMAGNAKKSRNAMLNLLLKVGIDSVRENLDVATIEILSIREAKAIEAFDLSLTEQVIE